MLFRSANTIVCRLLGIRLPAFLGGTLYQSESRLRRYYRSSGLTFDSAIHSRRFLGLPVFIGHVVRKWQTPLGRLLVADVARK